MALDLFSGTKEHVRPRREVFESRVQDNKIYAVYK